MNTCYWTGFANAVCKLQLSSCGISRQVFRFDTAHGAFESCGEKKDILRGQPFSSVLFFGCALCGGLVHKPILIVEYTSANKSFRKLSLFSCEDESFDFSFIGHVNVTFFPLPSSFFLHNYVIVLPGRSKIVILDFKTEKAQVVVLKVDEVLKEKALVTLHGKDVYLLAQTSTASIAYGLVEDTGDFVLKKCDDFCVPDEFCGSLTVIDFPFCDNSCKFSLGKDCCIVVFGTRSGLLVRATHNGCVINVTNTRMTAISKCLPVFSRTEDHILAVDESGGKCILTTPKLQIINQLDGSSVFTCDVLDRMYHQVCCVSGGRVRTIVDDTDVISVAEISSTEVETHKSIELEINNEAAATKSRVSDVIALRLRMCHVSFSQIRREHAMLIGFIRYCVSRLQTTTSESNPSPLFSPLTNVFSSSSEMVETEPALIGGKECTVACKEVNIYCTSEIVLVRFCLSVSELTEVEVDNEFLFLAFNDDLQEKFHTLKRVDQTSDTGNTDGTSFSLLCTVPASSLSVSQANTLVLGMMKNGIMTQVENFNLLFNELFASSLRLSVSSPDMNSQKLVLVKELSFSRLFTVTLSKLKFGKVLKKFCSKLELSTDGFGATGILISKHCFLTDCFMEVARLFEGGGEFTFYTVSMKQLHFATASALSIFSPFADVNINDYRRPLVTANQQYPSLSTTQSQSKRRKLSDSCGVSSGV